MTDSVAQELAEAEDINARTLLIDDDVSVQDSTTPPAAAASLGTSSS